MRRLLAALLAVLSLFTVGLGLGLRGGAAGQIGRALVPITAGSAWTPLVTVTADGTAASLDTGAFGVYPLLMAFIDTGAFTATEQPLLRFNGISTTSYTSRLVEAGNGAVALYTAGNLSGWPLVDTAKAVTNTSLTGSVLIVNKVLDIGNNNAGSHGPRCSSITSYVGGVGAGLPYAISGGGEYGSGVVARVSSLQLVYASGRNIVSGSTLEVWGSS